MFLKTFQESSHLPSVLYVESKATFPNSVLITPEDFIHKVSNKPTHGVPQGPLGGL